MAVPSTWVNGPWQLIEMPSETKDLQKPVCDPQGSDLRVQTTHAAYHVANQMMYAHNCMIRGLNALWLQSPHVHPGEDAKDLLFFANKWASWVMNHFELEEQCSFPGYMAIKGASKTTLPQDPERRDAIKSDIREFIAYCSFTASTNYSHAKFRALIKAFADPFVEHLHKEIPALLRLDAVGEEGGATLLAVLDETEKRAADQDKFVVPPMVMGLRDKTFDGGNNWPPLPFGVESLINYVLAWKHWRAWRFLPSDHWGIPRDLAFIPKS